MGCYKGKIAATFSGCEGKFRRPPKSLNAVHTPKKSNIKAHCPDNACTNRHKSYELMYGPQSHGHNYQAY